jgi:hypothetical protein
VIRIADGGGAEDGTGRQMERRSAGEAAEAAGEAEVGSVHEMRDYDLHQGGFRGLRGHLHATLRFLPPLFRCSPLSVHHSTSHLVPRPTGSLYLSPPPLRNCLPTVCGITSFCLYLANSSLRS